MFQYKVCSQMLVGNAGLGSFFNVGLLTRVFSALGSIADLRNGIGSGMEWMNSIKYSDSQT